MQTVLRAKERADVVGADPRLAGQRSAKSLRRGERSKRIFLDIQVPNSLGFRLQARFFVELGEPDVNRATEPSGARVSRTTAPLDSAPTT
jgi:hypothetical protein